MLARTYEENDIICSKGDKGDCMYVIFEGSVEVVGKNKKMGPNSILGRSALDTD